MKNIKHQIQENTITLHKKKTAEETHGAREIKETIT